MSGEGFGDAIEANARFYRAFETLDLEQMTAVWDHGEGVRCVHPGWPLLTGWDAVRAAWEAIFKNTVEMRFTISDVHAAGDGDVAWVTCTEHILSQVRGQVAVTSVLATNVFTRAAGGWRLVVHHASHVLSGAPSSEPLSE